jgi:hypothetical protein
MPDFQYRERVFDAFELSGNYNDRKMYLPPVADRIMGVDACSVKKFVSATILST